jgi:hypothetical protein
MQVVQRARIRRTKWFFEARQSFLAAIHADVWLFAEVAKRVGMSPAIRLNGTSDLMWERIGGGLPQAFPAIQFYDYTKIPGRRGLPPNYSLTFSFSGKNMDATRAVLERGQNVAVPFMQRPARWMGYPTIDGDDDDLRFLDPPGVVVALKAKGPLRRHPLSPFLGDNWHG